VRGRLHGARRQLTKKVLILGGTTEARQLAGKLAARADVEVALSLAGRTENPVEQPVPTRSGGFGGVGGLAAYLREEQINLLIDATHPYAANISRNAAEAALLAGIPIFALRRPAWEPVEGDRWMLVADAAEAVKALGAAPRKVFLALGRQEIAEFASAPQHAYVIRSVDPVEPPLDVPDATYILARGPFAEADELELLKTHRIDAIVAKNSGGSATYGKIAAARKLGIEVILFRRPLLPDVPSAPSVGELLAIVDHWLKPTEKRGV
jgi:precorrin-6A/cobalt-precorrin-6A reductase